MTTFHLRICGEDEKQIRGLACECFLRIDELEQKLSRYFVGGDVSRINSMVAGETLHLSDECYDCLLVSMEACMYTGGLFDPTLGAKIEHQKSYLKYFSLWVYNTSVASACQGRKEELLNLINAEDKMIFLEKTIK